MVMLKRGTTVVVRRRMTEDALVMLTMMSNGATYMQVAKEFKTTDKTIKTAFVRL
jgi:transcriptional regulator